METINIFATEWETVEATLPLPRRMRKMVILPFEEMKQKVLQQDPAFVKEMVESLYAGDVYLLKKAFPPEFMISIREKMHEAGRKTPPQFFKMLEGVPNFHRIIDAEIAKNYSFESIKHSYYFFPWNAEEHDLFFTTYPRWRIIKFLSGYDFNQYEKNTPKDGVTDRLQIVHYPSGAGKIETHSDPYKIQRLIISCFMSKRGKDYQSGGVYYIGQNNQKIDVENALEIGDMQIYYPTILHGVTTIDEGTTIDWNNPAGRWWFGPFSNATDHVAGRHTGHGVKELEGVKVA